MIQRLLEQALLMALREHPAVGLLGPRQVGKTTLARAVLRTLRDTRAVARLVYLDLERPSHQARLHDAEDFLVHQQDALVVIDEIQRMPEIFPLLRSLIDARRHAGQRAGHFLLLGSASISLLKQTSESLAGRICYLELTPFLLQELSAEPAGTRDRLWIRGGFPESYLAASARLSYSWRQNFLKTYLERDIPQLGPRVPATTLRRFWTMLAHTQGCTLNAARLGSGLGLSGQSIARYVDLMVDLLLVRRLPPWCNNLGKRLIRSPKLYIRDSGLLHALLRLRTFEEVLGHPVIGHSWEGFVIETLLNSLPADTPAWFYGTAAGAEVDLIIEPTSTERWAIEIKRAAAPLPRKSLLQSSQDVQATRRLIVYPGDATYRLAHAIEIMPLAAALDALLQATA